MRLGCLLSIVLVMICAVVFLQSRFREKRAMVYICVVRTDGAVDTSAISGTEVKVDDGLPIEAGGSVVLPLSLGLGKHEIAVTAPGYRRKVEAVEVSSDREKYVYIYMDRVRS